jgi:hypothetical protein
VVSLYFEKNGPAEITLFKNAFPMS